MNPPESRELQAREPQARNPQAREVLSESVTSLTSETALSSARAPTSHASLLERRPTPLGVGLGLILVAVLMPLLIGRSSYAMSLAINVTLLALISSGVWLTFAIGRINIAQGGFALLGAYLTAVLETRFALPFWLVLPLSGLGAALVGALIGWPILRLRGVYFSMLTLSLTEVARLVALNGGDLTRGASGIPNLPTPFTGENGYLGLYAVSVTLLLGGVFVLHRLTQTPIGGVFRALQQDEHLALSLGIPVARYRTLAFALCCGFGGLGGSLFAVFLQSVYPTSFTVTDSTNFMLYCFLGGLSQVLGPLVGSLGLFLGFQALSGLGTYQSLLYAALMIVAMMVLPNGLLSLRPRLLWRRNSTPLEAPL